MTLATAQTTERIIASSLVRNAVNLVPRAFSSTIFKMADRREKTLAKAGSRGTKSPKILEIFITWHFEKGQNKMAAKRRETPIYSMERVKGVARKYIIIMWCDRIAMQVNLSLHKNYDTTKSCFASRADICFT